MSGKHFFYGKPIIARNEQEYVQDILKKYKDQQATEELKQKIWDELQLEKQLGRLSIPFKVVLRKDPSEIYPPYVEVILDTKL